MFILGISGSGMCGDGPDGSDTRDRGRLVPPSFFWAPFFDVEENKAVVGVDVVVVVPTGVSVVLDNEEVLGRIPMGGGVRRNDVTAPIITVAKTTSTQTTKIIGEKRILIISLIILCYYLMSRISPFDELYELYRL
jgi:hypothetical protein